MRDRTLLAVQAGRIPGAPSHGTASGEIVSNKIETLLYLDQTQTGKRARSGPPGPVAFISTIGSSR